MSKQKLLLRYDTLALVDNWNCCSSSNLSKKVGLKKKILKTNIFISLT